MENTTKRVVAAVMLAVVALTGVSITGAGAAQAKDTSWGGTR